MRCGKITSLAVFSISLLVSCTEEPEYGGFETTTGSGDESIGGQSIIIDLGATVATATTITYQVSGSAALDGDYRLTSLMSYNSDALTITVPAGASKAEISFEIIDDNQIELSNEIIYFEITSISDADIANNFRQARYAFEIEDNDDAPDAALQVDLSWSLGDGVRINGDNFDLYLADSVMLNTDGTVDSYHLIENIESVHESGFESISLDDGLPDQPYYIIINYVSGTNTAELSLQFNSATIHRTASGRVSSASLGKALYFGPFTKSGNSYSFR